MRHPLTGPARQHYPPAMAQRMALYLQDKHDIRYELEIAKYAEEKGFSEIWQADTRLARDCVVLMSALLTETSRMRFGSGVLPIYTRNPAVIAATWSTMWELGGLTSGRRQPGDVGVGGVVGADRQPASGAGRRKPLTGHAGERRGHP